MTAKLGQREQNILIAGGTFAFIMLFFIYFLFPKWDQYNASQINLSNLKNRIETLKVERAKKLREKPESVEELKNQIRALRRQLPVTRETAGLFNFLITAANDAQVNLYQVNVGELKENNAVKGTKILPVNLKVNGSYSQLKNFTINLENLTRLNHITNVKFIREADASVTIDLSMEVYSWAAGDPSLNDSVVIPVSSLPGKPDPFNSVSSIVYSN